LLILLDAAYNDGCRKPRVLQYAFADQSRTCLGDDVLGNREATSPRERESFPCRYNAEASISLAADFTSFPERKKMGHRADFILRR